MVGPPQAEHAVVAETVVARRALVTLAQDALGQPDREAIFQLVAGAHLQDRVELALDHVHVHAARELRQLRNQEITVAACTEIMQIHLALSPDHLDHGRVILVDHDVDVLVGHLFPVELRQTLLLRILDRLVGNAR